MGGEEQTTEQCWFTPASNDHAAATADAALGGAAWATMLVSGSLEKSTDTEASKHYESKHAERERENGDGGDDDLLFDLLARARSATQNTFQWLKGAKKEVQPEVTPCFLTTAHVATALGVAGVAEFVAILWFLFRNGHYHYGESNKKRHALLFLSAASALRVGLLLYLGWGEAHL